MQNTSLKSLEDRQNFCGNMIHKYFRNCMQNINMIHKLLVSVKKEVRLFKSENFLSHCFASNYTERKLLNQTKENDKNPKMLN